MKKKIRVLFLSLVMLLELLPMGAMGAEYKIEEIVPCKYGEIGTFHEGLARVRSLDGKWGYIDAMGREVIPCTFDWAGDFSQGCAPVSENDLSSFIDTTGRLLLPFKYDDMGRFSEGLARVMDENRKWGYIDTEGNEVVPCKYSFADSFSGGIALVKDENGKYGYIDTEGNEVVPCKYNEAGSILDGYAYVVDENWNYGFIDATGKEVVPCKYSGYDSQRKFFGGLGRVWDENGKVGYIDKTLNEVIPCKYDYGNYFSEGLALVGNKGDGGANELGYIDFTGKEITPFRYIMARDFSEGFAWVMDENHRYGVIDSTGREVVPCTMTYTSVEEFSENLARVEVNGKYGFIDSTGREVVPCKYDHASSFNDGMAAVYQDDKEGFIDATGKEIIPCMYGSIYFIAGLAAVEVGEWPNSKCGLIDITGKEILPCIYDNIGKNWGIAEEAALVAEGYIKVKLDGKWGILFVKDSSAPLTADPTNDALTVDGKGATPTAYKIGGANYFPLRDVAMLLSGTKAQFSVEYDGEHNAVKLTTGKAYTPQGWELAGAASQSQEAIVGNDSIYINGEKADFTVFKIGGSNFFQIRDLGKALGFNVGWTAEKGMFIESDKPYTDAD